MVDIKIVASRQRQEMVENLRDALELTDQDIFYDESAETGNPYLPVKQTWLLPHEEGVTHRVVLNDDVQVCNGFKQIIEQITQSHPDCAFSLFTMAFDGDCYNGFISGLDSPYIRHDWSMWGCAILLPIGIVEECFNYIEAVFGEDALESHGILSFLKHKQIPVLSTIPVTVQHIGDDSLYDPSLPVRRSSRFEENPTADWTSTQIENPPVLEWFKPRQTGKVENRTDRILNVLRGVNVDE
ncbi:MULTISPECIES: hypothetical protein [Allobaculum]|uniref:hypothetical protein n=1 Tax=Allobaculum TaxID=174708 RepID=UPI001E4DA198|nr:MULTISPECIES: hypothetical protein [Allobaculum]UNT94272.1 hypothetical protein KWG61_06645 [Allobaculum sp. Allo2]